MRPILVLYATREGHCRKIADHIAAHLRAKQLPARVLNAAELRYPFTLGNYRGALLIAPVHASFHAREMEQFLESHREELEHMPVLLLSVSLSEAGAENAEASAESREKAAGDVSHLIALLHRRTGFPERKVAPVAGALAYTQYGFLKRLVMRHISRQAGGSTDTSRDHVYTDFEALDKMVDDFVAPLLMPSEAPAFHGRAL